MAFSPEDGPRPQPEIKEVKESIPFITVDMDRATPEDYKRLEELGWTKSSASAFAGEMTFLWENDEEPVLPEELAEKVIGTKDGKIQRTIWIPQNPDKLH